MKEKLKKRNLIPFSFTAPERWREVINAIRIKEGNGKILSKTEVMRMIFKSSSLFKKYDEIIK